MKKSIKSELKPGLRKKPKPVQSWQTGEFEKHANLNLIIPDEVLLICRLFDIKPSDLISQLLDKLSAGKADASPLFEYLMENGVCKTGLEAEAIEGLFAALEAIKSLWPHGADMEFLEYHATWRNKYLEYLYHKWSTPPSR